MATPQSGKLSKVSVHYRRAGYGATRRCGNCVMFRSATANWPGSCTLVAGPVKPVDVCDRWEAKPP